MIDFKPLRLVKIAAALAVRMGYALRFFFPILASNFSLLMMKRSCRPLEIRSTLFHQLLLLRQETQSAIVVP
ncbi:hypothetical protein [Desulfosarcina sp.]|uniref:hypothetical protein n=1 Tax=Desulfosarcina sp. TaxID=2027861 RepID=UPI00397046A7